MGGVVADLPVFEGEEEAGGGHGPCEEVVSGDGGLAEEMDIGALVVREGGEADGGGSGGENE